MLWPPRAATRSTAAGELRPLHKITGRAVSNRSRNTWPAARRRRSGRTGPRFASRPRMLVDREPIGHDHPTDPAPPFWLSTVAAEWRVVPSDNASAVTRCSRTSSSEGSMSRFSPAAVTDVGLKTVPAPRHEIAWPRVTGRSRPSTGTNRTTSSDVPSCSKAALSRSLDCARQQARSTPREGGRSI